MMRMLKYGCIALCIFVSAAARGDWNPGDPFKMLDPQLPDPNGWDVKIDEANVVADDFLCTETGPITVIHFWGSWKGDLLGVLSNIHLSIHSDIPDPDPLNPDDYSMPGDLLWEYNTFDHDPSLVTWRADGTGTQGWFDPAALPPVVLPGNHTGIVQYNVSIDPVSQFSQQEGTIYWLDIHVVNDTPGTEFGWKTSINHWNDDAVWEEPITGDWMELRDPLEPTQSLDMAFVVVPEPRTTLLVLAAGVAGFLRRRARQRQAAWHP